MSNGLHLAIIMDGNGRWASNLGKSRTYGHEHGAKNIKPIAFFCAKHSEIKVLTLFAFSTENWKRPKEEINFLFNLPILKLKPVLEEFNKEKIRIKFIGFENNISANNLIFFKEVEESTRDNDKLLLNICLNYGSRQEIFNAAKKFSNTLEKFEENFLTYDEKTKDFFNVDILIRTGNEKRLSNFLLYQSAYAEIFFSELMWPEFNVEKLNKVIEEFKNRKRKFGALN